MNTEPGTTTQTATSNCVGCDVGGVACSTERYKRQAVVAEESTTAMTGYQEKYDGARAAYTKARTDAESDVKWSKDTLKKIKKALECILSDDQRKCLKDSLKTVTAAIKECSGGSATGCCVGDCSYPYEPTEGETASSLAGLIAQYRRAAADNQACFDSLIKLLTEIPQVTAKLKADVAALENESKSADATTAVRLFARYLVLKHQLSGGGLFGGFANVNAYMDCLCKAMQCSYAAWQAVIELEGRKAFLECQDKAAQAECERKKKDILEDLLCEYEKCKPATPSDGGDDDCGCGQHSHGTEAQSS